MRVGLLQLTSGDDPASNLNATLSAIREAAGQGATFILTPEVTNCVSTSRTHQQAVLQHEADDQTLAALRSEAATLGVWVSVGSLALKTDDPDGRFANRSFLIEPTGAITARYDKMHMFDVTVSDTETTANLRATGRVIAPLLRRRRLVAWAFLSVTICGLPIFTAHWRRRVLTFC